MNELLETAWGIIANAGGGDWTRESPEWQAAAERWRDVYIAAATRLGLTLSDRHRRYHVKHPATDGYCRDKGAGVSMREPALEPIQIAEGPLAKLLQQCPRLHLGKNAKDWDEAATWLAAHGVAVLNKWGSAGIAETFPDNAWRCLLTFMERSVA